MPTTIPMPPVTIWDQFEVVGILLVFILVFGYALYRLLGEYTTWQTAESKEQRVWQETQFEKRETENKAQRAWYEGMERKREEEQGQRDRQWQQFYAEIANQQARQSRDNNEVLSKLISRIDALTDGITSHEKSSKARAERLEDMAIRVIGKPRRAA